MASKCRSFISLILVINYITKVQNVNGRYFGVGVQLLYHLHRKPEIPVGKSNGSHRSVWNAL